MIYLKLDEVHLLYDSRGSVLEALVARTIRLVEQSQSMIRIVRLVTLQIIKMLQHFYIQIAVFYILAMNIDLCHSVEHLLVYVTIINYVKKIN